MAARSSIFARAIERLIDARTQQAERAVRAALAARNDAPRR